MKKRFETSYTGDLEWVGWILLFCQRGSIWISVKAIILGSMGVCFLLPSWVGEKGRAGRMRDLLT